MSDRGWKFAERWVAANVRRDILPDPGERIDLNNKVEELRTRLFDDALKEDITPVEIEEYYDLNNYLAEALSKVYDLGSRVRAN